MFFADFCRRGRESYKYNDDIALVQVKESIEFNEFVQPACLPDDVSLISFMNHDRGEDNFPYSVYSKLLLI